MSAGAAHFPAFTVAHGAAEARPAFDRELAEACRALLRDGPVAFKFESRVDVGSLPKEMRRTVNVVRRLPAGYRIKPMPTEEHTVFTDWHKAVESCRSVDDQLMVFPVNRVYPKGRWTRTLVCRPKDKTDEARFNAMDSVFGSCGAACPYPNPSECPDLIANVRETQVRVANLTVAHTDLDRRVRALEGGSRADLTGVD